MMSSEERLCRKFAMIIEGQPGFAGGKCVATISRQQIRAFILGKKFGVTSSFSFESLNKRTGKALCLGRVALLQKKRTVSYPLFASKVSSYRLYTVNGCLNVLA